MYQINGEDRIFDWLSREADPTVRNAFLDWLPYFADRPADAAFAQRIEPPHIYIANVPGTAIFVDYLIAEQYRTILVLGITAVDSDL